MVAKKMLSIVIWVIVIGAICAFCAGEPKPSVGGSNPSITVGTFDSRAVAVVFAHSKLWEQKLEQMKKALNDAKAAGDTNKVKEIEQWGPAQQKKLHIQGFGTADVSDLLEYVEDDIPKIAKEVGVDIIVSKWDIVYQSPSAKTVDITDALIKPFRPDEKVRKIIQDLRSKPPIANEIVEKIDSRE